MNDELFLIKVEIICDDYGVKPQRSDEIVGIFDSQETVEKIVRNINLNPHFNGNVFVIPFELNVDYLGYSK